MDAEELAQPTQAVIRADRPFDWRRDGRWLLAIVLVALTLRVIYILQLRSADPFFGREIMDPLYHQQWAQACAAGETFNKGPYFRAPLYPWFLGVIYWLIGSGPIGARLVQALLGSLSCGLVFLIGRQTFSRATGILAGFAAASYWILLYFDAELLISVLIVFLDLLLILLLLRTGGRSGWWRWLLNGFVLGVSAVARPNILLFAPPLVLWLVVLHRPRWRRVLGYAACFVLGCSAPIIPITVRNWVVGHDLVLISSQAGVNFYIGNNPTSDGMSAVVPGTPVGWWEGYYAAIAQAEEAVGRKLKPSEVSRYYSSQALKFMADRPRQAAALMLKKLGFFWSRWEIGNNKDIRFVTSTYTPVVKCLPLGFWIVGPLGVLGLVLTLGDARRLFPLWGFAFVYMISVVLFFVTARYRVPVVVVLILLSSHAVCWLVGALRRRSWRGLGLAALVLALISPVVARVPPDVDVNMAQGYCYAGLDLANLNRWAEAEAMLTESVKRWPDNPLAWYGLGHVFFARQNPVRAAECFTRTLELAPDHLDARNNLGAVLAGRMKLDAAIEQFESVLQRMPNHLGALTNLGAALVQRGQVEEGLARFQRALATNPDSAQSLLRTTTELCQRGRYAQAVRLLQGGLETCPDRLELLLTLSKLLATCSQEDLRDGPQAVRLAERACELTGRQDAQALAALAAAHFSIAQTDEAIRLTEEAIALATAQGPPSLVAQLRVQLDRYRGKQDRSD